MQNINCVNHNVEIPEILETTKPGTKKHSEVVRICPELCNISRKVFDTKHFRNDQIREFCFSLEHI